MTSTYSLANLPRRVKEDGERDANRYENLVLALSRRAERIVREHGERLQQFWADAADAYGRVAAAAKEGRLVDDAKAYATDAARRGALMLDILRERADRDAAHEAAGTPPVLIYDYDVDPRRHDVVASRATRCCSKSFRPRASKSTNGSAPT